MVGHRGHDDDPTDGVVDVSPRRARDVATGAEVYSVDRDAEVYELDGRRWQLFVERAPAAIGIWLSERPTWDDGTPVTEAEVEVARAVLVRVYRHWGSTVDFVAPEPAAPPVGHIADGSYLDPSGAVLGGGGADSIDLTLRGRRWQIPVTRGPADEYRIVRDPVWDDGSPVSAEDRDLASHCLRSFSRLSGRRFQIVRLDLSAP